MHEQIEKVKDSTKKLEEMLMVKRGGQWRVRVGSRGATIADQRLLRSVMHERAEDD